MSVHGISEPVLRTVFAAEVAAMIEAAIDERIEALRCELNGAPFAASAWLDRQAAAAYLRVSTPTIDRLRRLGRLTPEYAGRRPLYHRDELDAFARSGRGGDVRA